MPFMKLLPDFHDFQRFFFWNIFGDFHTLCYVCVSFLSDFKEFVTKFREKTMKRDLITSKRDWTANDRAYASNQFFRIFSRCFPNLNQWWSPEQQLCWNKWWWLRHLQTPKLNGTDILNSISTVRQQTDKNNLLHSR